MKPTIIATLTGLAVLVFVVGITSYQHEYNKQCESWVHVTGFLSCTGIEDYTSSKTNTLNPESIFLMEPDSVELFYYPNPEDTENRDPFDRFMLIRLPAWLGGMTNDASAYRAYSLIGVDDHCMVKYWEGEERQRIENPCRGGFYRSVDGAMTVTFGAVPGVYPIALPHLDLSSDENGLLFIDPPKWSKTQNGVIGYGKEITHKEIVQGSEFLIESFAEYYPKYPAIPLEFAGYLLADIRQGNQESFEVSYSEYTPLSDNIEIIITKCNCQNLQGHYKHEMLENIGDTVLAISNSSAIHQREMPERFDNHHIKFARDGFSFEVIGKNLEFMKSEIASKFLDEN